LIQFGQKEGTVATALGYGRSVVGETGKNTGNNVFPWLNELFACVQYHHTMGVKGLDSDGKTINVDEAATVDDNILARALGVTGFQGALTDRSVIRQGNLNELEQFATDLVHEREHHQKLNSYGLYPDREDVYGNGHHWGMYVDLNGCIGCGACQVACIAENNVPVVGKVEVARHHEMTWMRIDRYYYGD